MSNNPSQSQIAEAAEQLATIISEHPECDRDKRDEAIWTGTPRKHVVFSLGRLPDISIGEGTLHPAAPPPQTPEERLLAALKGGIAPLEMLNPMTRTRGLGLGPGTMAASFGIHLEPTIGFTPKGYRPIEDVIKEGMPDPETSGIMPMIKEDIEVAKALTPNWYKLGFPDMQGPFNIAHMVLGDDAFIAPLMEPDKWAAFMDIVTDFFIESHKVMTRWIGSERIQARPERIHRIAECSVNMVGHSFYMDHILKYDRRIVDYYGEVAIHPCSGPHVFHATLDHLPNVVWQEAGRMINKMSAGSISVDEALTAIGDRPIVLSIGEELPAGEEAEVVRGIFERTMTNPRCTYGFCGLGWLKKDEPTMREFHARMNEVYAELIEG